MANILIDVGHPAHVHLFRNAASEWQLLGHSVHWLALDREIIPELLERYSLPYSISYRRRSGRFHLLREIPIRTWRTLAIAREKAIDLFVSMTNPTVGLPALLLGKPYMAFTDTEPAYNQIAVALPFATAVLTPKYFGRELGSKHVRYAGTHELAYLHPKHFQPQSDIYEALGLSPNEKYAFVRFVAWKATHDKKEHGLSAEDKHLVVEELKKYGKVIISTEEGTIEPSDGIITDYPKERINDILAFASIYVGEGNTMAAEAAVLGTASIRANTMKMGYCSYLEDNGLMFQHLEIEVILHQIRSILDNPDAKASFLQKRDKVLNENLPTTDFIVDYGLRLLNSAR